MSSTHENKPNSVPDFILLGVTICLLIPFLVANIVVYRNRKRKYFQASGWELTLGCSFAGIISIGSALIVNQHFRRDRFKLFSSCALWTFWFQLIFGVCLWLCCMALRLHHLHVFCTTGKPPCRWRVWGLYLPAMMAPAIIFGIVATAMRISSHPCGIEGSCVIDRKSWKLITYWVLPPFYFFLIVILLYHLRKEKDYLLRTECQHIKDYVMMAFVIYLLTGSTYWTAQQNIVGTRCFLTFTVCSVVFVHFWVHTGWPVYLCFFRKAEEMDTYEESLRRHGARCLKTNPDLPQEDVDENDVIPRTFSSEGEEAIFQAITGQQRKKEELKTKKDHLQRRLTEMRSQIEELKHQKALDIPPERLSQSMPLVKGKGLPDLVPITRHLSFRIYSINSSPFPSL
ncbi:unnamed protein product [Calypogeia fissa]